MRTLRSLLVVGANAASSALIDQLREDGFSGDAVILDPDSRARIAGGEVIQATATSLDPDNAVVMATLPDGSRRPYTADQIVIACGSVAPSLPGNATAVQRVRNLADARLPTAPGRRCVVVGAGSTGAEVASALIEAGQEVTVVERADRPLDWLLGGHLGTDVAAWMGGAGVQLILGAEAMSIDEGPGGIEVSSSAGVIECDEVFSAVGSKPDLAWLKSSGLDVQDGVRCTSDGRALSSGQVVPRVHGIGEGATWLAGDSVYYRGSQWPTPGTQGRTVARRLLGLSPSDVVIPDLPFCWSNQFGRLIQVVGTPMRNGTLVSRLAEPERDKALHAITYAGCAVAWAAVNAQAELFDRLGPLLYSP